MPLSEEDQKHWRQHLIRVAHKRATCRRGNRGTCSQCKETDALFHLVDELDRLGKIETAAREYVRTAEYAYALDSTRSPGKEIQDATFAETAAYDALQAAVGTTAEASDGEK